MSMEVHVFLEKRRLPAVEQWQASLKSNSIDITFLSGSPIMQQSGFLPVLYKGEETGFELSVSSAKEIVQAYQHIGKVVGERDLSVNFAWGGDLQECIAAIASSAVLTFLTDGIFYDPQEDKYYLKESVLSIAKQTVADIEAS